MTAAAAWTAALREWARERAAMLGIDATRVEIAPVVNPSGWFANESFRLTDGRVRLHGKLAPAGADTIEDMARAYTLGDALRPYHAPAFVAWIELDGWCGYLTEHVAGVVPARTLVPEIVEVIERLHQDEGLLAALPQRCATTRDAFAELFLTRFVEDLAHVGAAAERPPFVARETFAWMHDEVARLRERLAITAFDEPARAVVHGDLHLGNVLVEPSGRWWIVDWDELHRGDAAIELAILLRPWVVHGDAIDRFVAGTSAAFRARFGLACRAVVLDEIVDTLADWVAAPVAPTVAAQVRAEKQRVHTRALAEYHARFG